MNSTVYALNPLQGLYGHTSQQPLAFCDEINMERLELEAHVRSGDYFATLATQLDQLSFDLATTDKEALQRFVSDLLYLQQHFEINKK